MRRWTIAIGCLAILAMSPAFAQTKVTDNCTGQPTYTGSDMGEQTGLLAFPSGAGLTQNSISAGGLCTPGEVTGIDSVYCFIPQNIIQATPWPASSTRPTRVDRSRSRFRSSPSTKGTPGRKRRRSSPNAAVLANV